MATTQQPLLNFQRPQRSMRDQATSVPPLPLTSAALAARDQPPTRFVTFGGISASSSSSASSRRPVAPSIQPVSGSQSAREFHRKRSLFAMGAKFRPALWEEPRDSEQKVERDLQSWTESWPAERGAPRTSAFTRASHNPYIESPRHLRSALDDIDMLSVRDARPGGEIMRTLATQTESWGEYSAAVLRIQQLAAQVEHLYKLNTTMEDELAERDRALQDVAQDGSTSEQLRAMVASQERALAQLRLDADRARSTTGLELASLPALREEMRTISEERDRAVSLNRTRDEELTALQEELRRNQEESQRRLDDSAVELQQLRDAKTAQEQQLAERERELLDSSAELTRLRARESELHAQGQATDASLNQARDDLARIDEEKRVAAAAALKAKEDADAAAAAAEPEKQKSAACAIM